MQISIFDEIERNKPKPKVMKVLVACEESQRVCIAFREKGHEAYSCDIQECSGGHPEWHIKGDVLKILNPHIVGCTLGIWFRTEDFERHFVEKWDLIIAHPPCTYLTGAGAANIPKHPERIDLGFKAAEIFKKFLNLECERICVENPPPMERFNIPPYTQLIRPYMFGDVNNKPICLWLKGLPQLIPTNVVEKDTDIIVWHDKYGNRKSCSRWYNTDTANHSKHRSKTFIGVAKAMAEQWG